MPVVFLITIVAVLVGIFFAATGRGGELAYEHADHAPLDLGPVSAADVALFRPPTALWGYNMQVTDEALDQIARAMRERDVTIAYLQEQLATFERNGSYTEPRGAHARQAAGLAPGPGIPGLPGAAETLEAPRPADPFGVSAPEASLDDLLRAEAPEDALPEEAPEAPEATLPEAMLPAEALEAPEATLPAEAPEAPEAPEATLPAEAPPGEAAPSAGLAETPADGLPGPPRTPLVLKASGAKAPPAPEPHEATQPSETLQDPEPYETTQPNEIRDPTQPSAVLAPDDAHGPQGGFNAHEWWAEQREAARQEDAGPPAGTGEGQKDDPLAAAEEQGW